MWEMKSCGSQWVKMKNKLVIALLVIAGFWGVTSLGNNTNKNCINVYVDYGSLDNNKKVISCIDTDHKESALVVLGRAGVNIEGTQKYGLRVVCRVNSLPKPSQESCESMPPEDAYWAVIIKEPIGLSNKWNWASTGISEVYLNPGEYLGLVFVRNGDMKWPS